MKVRIRKGAARRLGALLFLGALWLPAEARAQTTTGTLRGNVTDETGASLPGATVTATNDRTGFNRSATTVASGFYNLSLIPGPYTVVFTLPSFATVTQKTEIRVGETQALDVKMNLEARAQAAVTVTAEAPIIETKTNEIATNVSQAQIRNLPQSSRNFLNFAELAPGVRVTDSTGTSNSSSVQTTAAGEIADHTNVFIDGTSYKNDVITGGIVGQDSSRGNPFPQAAVQEFRVLSQNYKAEYEQASTTIITAITRSGGNKIQGDAFGYYQNKNLVARDPFAGSGAKPDYTRYQAGADFGGPIIEDRLHYFLTYELNFQNRSSVVAPGPQFSQAPASVQSLVSPFFGNFQSPFRENLAFGKISWQAGPSSLLDVSGNLRHETDVKDFGQQRSFQSATNTKQNIWNAQAKFSQASSSFLSDTTVSYLNYQWEPTATNPGTIGQQFDNVLQIGSGNNFQNVLQKKAAFREDFSYLGLHAGGDHVIKAGLIASAAHYDVSKAFNTIPLFEYRSDENYAFPYQAFFGFGNPAVSAANNQYGVYLQDDWSVSPRLTVNAGIRWDYETNPLNNHYVTPAFEVAELSSKVSSDFFTNGSQRPPYKNEFQPRLGFSYDVTGKGTSVVFGGVGRYFDRDEFNYGLDERYRLQFTTLTFRFSADGKPRPEGPTIMWNPSYLSVAGLQGLIASGAAGKPDAFLINNNTKPPVNDQFSFGFRQSFGNIATSVSYAGIRGRNGYTYVFGNRNPDGSCCNNPIAPDFGNLLLSSANKRFWYDAVYVTADKPYTTQSNWGAGLAYTHAKATQTGNDLFSLDYVNVNSYQHPTANDERDRVVVHGIVGIPFDVRFAALITLGSGLPYTIADASQGFGVNQFRVRLNEGRQSGTFPYQSFDFRLQKDFLVSGTARLGVSAELFNAFNHHNYGCFDGFIAPTSGAPNAHFGQPGCLVTDGRRTQFGVNVGF
jgi:hypothetical protein